MSHLVWMKTTRTKCARRNSKNFHPKCQNGKRALTLDTFHWVFCVHTMGLRECHVLFSAADVTREFSWKCREDRNKKLRGNNKIDNSLPQPLNFDHLIDFPNQKCFRANHKKFIALRNRLGSDRPILNLSAIINDMTQPDSLHLPTHTHQIINLINKTILIIVMHCNFINAHRWADTFTSKHCRADQDLFPYQRTTFKAITRGWINFSICIAFNQ